MEKRIKTLYIITIIAIITFLGMQMYWLYSRYEFSLREYEHHTEAIIADALVEYNKARTKKVIAKINSSYSMSHGVDSTGHSSRKVTVSSIVMDGRKLLGINEERNLTENEIERLAKIVSDSMERVEEKRLSIDASTAPSDGAAWAAMQNFDLEIQSPFTIQGIDSLLDKENINAKISLVTTDSIMWKSVTYSHQSLINPSFQIISPYSELERKAVIIDCRIPVADVVKEMGWTLIFALVLSFFLIVCLIWQFSTILKLTRLDKMRNSFITTMIHELKRPISTLKMCVSGIENEQMMSQPEVKEELVGETRNALDNLSAYFSKLRDITFNNVDQIPLNPTNIDLNKMFEDIKRNITIPSGKAVSITSHLKDSITITADYVHLSNVLGNLVENAIKYSGESVDIDLSATLSDNLLTLSVKDNGYGIPQSDLQRIFNRFYRSKNAIKSDLPGMGLGLAYVKLLIEAHGGNVTVESEEGIGSCFIITLPQ